MSTNTNSSETSSKSVDDLAEENKMLRSRVIVLESECDLLSKHCVKYQKEIEQLVHSSQYLDGEAINNVIRDLPFNFQINISIRKRYLDIKLVDTRGCNITPPLADMDEQINYCVEHAKGLVKS